MDRNIFEAAANQPKKKSPIQTSPPHSDQPVPQLTPPPLKLKNFGTEDPEVAEMFVKMKNMSMDLESQLDEVKRKGEAKKFDVEGYIKKLSNFSAAEIENNILDQKNFEEKVNKVFPPEACLKKLKKTKEKLTKERNSKFIGSRNKWIPMQ